MSDAGAPAPAAEPRRPLMEAIEGGEDAPSMGFVDSIRGTLSWFAKEIADDFTLVKHDPVRTAGADAEPEERLQEFARLQREYARLETAATRVVQVLRACEQSHHGFGVSLTEHTAALASGSDALDEKCSRVSQDASSVHDKLAKRSHDMAKTVEDLAQTLQLMKDKVLEDVHATVRLYQRNRALLAACDDDLAALERATNGTAALDKLEAARQQRATLAATVQGQRDAIDAKLALLNEKRHRDLRALLDITNLALSEYVRGACAALGAL